MTDAPNHLLTVPPGRCLVCGADGERPGGICGRCGATDADALLLLRRGAQEYGDARSLALSGRYSEARESLRVASGLGLGAEFACTELSRLLSAIDPPVSSGAAEEYIAARRLAETGRFTAAMNTALPDTPAARELDRLCAQGATLDRKAAWRNGFRIAGVGAACAAAAFWLYPRIVLPPPQSGSASMDAPASPVPTPAPSAGSPPPPPLLAAVSPSPTPYPYPERLTRRYYNDALSAFREERYDTAAALADLAAETGKNTYLLPHALLLRARIADITGDDDAPRFWAKIAADSPSSPYAPMALLRAAESAKKISGKRADVAPYLQELIDRYPLSNEARTARKRFPPVE